MSEFDLIDLWRVQNPTLRQFTWRRSNPRKMRRLDYLLSPNDLQFEVKSCEILAPLRSDHSPVFLKFKSSVDGGTRGPGRWKFNNSVVNDATFINEMQDLINKESSNFNEFDDPRINFEFFKYKIRNFAREYSINKTFQRKGRLETKYATDSSEETCQQHEKAKKEPEKIYDYITEGIILRSKTTFYEEREKTSKYFLSLEKSNKIKSSLRKLKWSEQFNEVTVDPKCITAELRNFYSELYTPTSLKSETECMDYLRSLNLPKLSNNGRLSCEGKLTLQECWEALNSMKKCKTPENDSLTKEFYVCFFKQLGKLLVSTLNYSFDHGEMSTSQKQAIIVLIQKKDRDQG